jgi:CheY-like chemotaxis protein
MPRSILLADDSVTIQKAVGMTFAGEEIALSVAADGESALSRAREARPDLVLADISMPGLSGYELCQRIRSDGALRSVPVLLIGQPVDPAKWQAVGANGHLTKPFDSTKLLDHVRQLLANPSLQIAPAGAKPAPLAAPALVKPAPAAAPQLSRPPPAAPAPVGRPPSISSTAQMARPPAPAGSAPPPA